MDAQRLEGLPLFESLGKDELRRIASLTDEVDIREGEELLHQGDFAHEFMVVIDGSAEVVRDSEHVADLGPGDFLGEIALIDDSPRTATATTETPTKLLVLSRREFRSLMDGHPSIEAAVLRCLIERVKTHEPTFSH